MSEGRIASGMTAFEVEDQLGSGAYPKRPTQILRGEGVRLWDAQGNSYLDMTSGQGVALLGHAHPAVVRAVEGQANRLITCPEIFYNDRRAELYELLEARLPLPGSRMFLCNSGAEAIEGALKLARLKTERSKIVAFRGGFHGRTLGALSTTWNPAYRRPFEPLLPEVTHREFNEAADAESEIDEATAAVLVEVIQGEGGVNPATGGFLEALRRACDRTGALLVVDEIQTGLGRTGVWWASEAAGVLPDILCLGKGIAGGLPMGVVVWRAALGPLPAGSHGSTFGGNPMACAAAIATLTTLEEERLPAQAGQLGGEFLEELAARDHPMVRAVRGRGLMIGLELRKRVTPALKVLMDRGVLALPAGSTVLRLLPPLIVSREELATVRRALFEVLDEMMEG